jgi:hypothetical protein
MHTAIASVFNLIEERERGDGEEGEDKRDERVKLAQVFMQQRF